MSPINQRRLKVFLANRRGYWSLWLFGILFILSLGGLSKQETARRGNTYGIVGMVLAIVAVLVFMHESENLDLNKAAGVLGGTIILGFVIGGVLAARVAMTAMPQLVAILHSFVGLAAVFVGLSSYLKAAIPVEGTSHTVHLIEIWLGVAIGATVSYTHLTLPTNREV